MVCEMALFEIQLNKEAKIKNNSSISFYELIKKWVLGDIIVNVDNVSEISDNTKLR